MNSWELTQHLFCSKLTETAKNFSSPMLLRDLSYEDRKLGCSLSSCFEREESEEWRDKIKHNTEDYACVVSLIPKTNTYFISSSFIPEISKSKITYKPL